MLTSGLRALALFLIATWQSVAWAYYYNGTTGNYTLPTLPSTASSSSGSSAKSTLPTLYSTVTSSSGFNARSTSTSTAVGAYVAQGLGLQSATVASTYTLTTTSSSTTSPLQLPSSLSSPTTNASETLSSQSSTSTNGSQESVSSTSQLEVIVTLSYTYGSPSSSASVPPQLLSTESTSTIHASIVGSIQASGMGNRTLPSIPPMTGLAFNSTLPIKPMFTSTNSSEKRSSRSTPIGTGLYTAVSSAGAFPFNVTLSSVSRPYPTNPSQSRFRKNATSPTGTGSIPYPTRNLSYTTDCWDQWSQYYDLVVTSNVVDTNVTLTWTQTAEVLSAIPTPFVSVWTETISDGGFAANTILSTLTVSSSWTEVDDGTVTGVYSTSTTVASQPNATAPSCVLPPVVPQCQEQWVDWASQMYPLYSPTPVCTQASISGAICNDLQASYVTDQGLYDLLATTTTTWDGASQLAPGCTIGCQQCRITGTSVQILYWPPETRNGSNLTMTRTAPALVTATGFGTTFTSPTVYISFDTLYASDSCSGIGATYYNKIVAVPNSADLSTQYGWSLGGVLPSASFNFSDLYVTPVPSSIYNSQPYCHSVYTQEHREMNQEDGWAYFNCWNGAGDYRPILAIPALVRDLDPAWADCIGAVAGVYDPPKALQPVTAAASVTGPVVVSTTSAAPASSLSSLRPLKTLRPMVLATTQQSVVFKSVASTGAAPTANSGGASIAPNVAGSEDATDAGSSAVVVTADPAAHSSDGTAAPSGTTPDSSQGAGAGNQATSSGVIPADPVTPAGAGGDTTNALSVLAAAQATPEPAVVVTSGQGGGDPTSQAHGSGDAQAMSSADGDPAVYTTLPGQDSVAFQGPASTPPVGGTYPAGATLTLGGQPVTAIAQPGGMIVAAQGTSGTLDYGSEATFAGVAFSVPTDGSSIIADGTSTVQLPPSQMSLAPSRTVLQVGGQPVTAVAQSGGGVVLAGSSNTLAISSGSEATFAGQAVEVRPDGSGIVVGGTQTVIIGVGQATPTLPSLVFQVDVQPVTAVSNSNGVVLAEGSSTLAIPFGSEATFAGYAVEAQPGSSAIVMDGIQTVSLGTGQTAPTPPGAVFAVDGHSVTAFAQPGSVIIAEGGSTLTLPAGAEATFAGQAIEVQSDGSDIVIGWTQTESLGMGQTALPLPAAVFALDGQTVTALARSGSVVLAESGSTLTVPIDGSATFAGHALSVMSGGSSLVLDGTRTIGLTPSGVSAPQQTPVEAVWTGRNGDLFTAYAAQGDVVVGQGATSVTLSYGATAVVDGETLSVGSNGGFIVDGTSTIILSPPMPTGESAVWTDSAGDIFTAYARPESFVIAGKYTTFTLSDGEKTTFGGQMISAGSTGGYILDGTSTITMSPPRSTGSSAVWTDAAGNVFTAVYEHGSFVVVAGGTTVTLLDGGATVIGGQRISACSTGGFTLDGLSTITMSPRPSGAAAVWTDAAGHIFTAFAEHGSFVVAGDGSTITLPYGGTAIFDGETISAASTGGVLVIDGTTVSVPTATGQGIATPTPTMVSAAASTSAPTQTGVDPARGHSAACVARPGLLMLTGILCALVVEFSVG